MNQTRRLSLTDQAIANALIFVHASTPDPDRQKRRSVLELLSELLPDASRDIPIMQELVRAAIAVIATDERPREAAYVSARIDLRTAVYNFSYWRLAMAYEALIDAKISRAGDAA